MKQIYIFSLITILSTNFYAQEYVPSTIALITDSDAFTTANAKDKTTKEKIDEWTKVEEVYLYGGGSILGLVTASGKVNEAASPTGSIGINFKTKRLTCNLFFSYNSKQTVKVDSLYKLGNSLMNPNLGGQSFSFSVQGAINNYAGVYSSFHIADNTWKLNDSTAIDASPLILRFGLYVNPFRFNLNDNTVKLTLNLNYTHRSILGDFNNGDQLIQGNIISPRGYNGVDFSVNAYLNSVKIYVQFSANSKGNILIPGFSGSQVLFGIDIAGKLIKLK